jgi:signal transduction histidine kinase
MRQLSLRYLHYPAFIALYLLFDWATYLYPLYGLNITPWNPDPALGLVFWLRYGRRAALPLFLALLGGELLVRGMPAGPLVTLAGALWLTAAYCLMGAILRRDFTSADMFDNRGRLFHWVLVVAAGTLFNGIGYISLLSAAGLVPAAQWGLALMRFGIGDMVGILVSMPLFWMLASARGRARLRRILVRGETLAYLALAMLVLYAVFGTIASAEFKHFYFLFLPVIWAASRQGLYGTALIVFVLQTGIIALVKWHGTRDLAVYELQMLDAVLALVGFFIGIVVDELRKVAAELRQSLRLAAAGEMAAALAHELNQPLTALSAYGKACEHLLERGGNEALLRDAIGRMLVEAGRAADVVRRLRDFFRTGAMRFETVSAAALVRGIAAQFQLPFRQHGIVLTVDVDPAMTLRADRLQVELVLRNLLDNASDAVLACPADARRISVTAAPAPDGRLRLSVEDSGAGVSEALAARLFEPFASSKASGLGLGLVLSRAIVEAHGGSLWAEVGTHGVFRFDLPMAAAGEPLAT